MNYGSICICHANAPAVYINNGYCGYHYIRQSSSLAHGRSFFNGARHYWNDSIFLSHYKEEIPSAYFDEWALRAMIGHIRTFWRFKDAYTLVKLFSTAFMYYLKVSRPYRFIEFTYLM